jgi:ribonuclease VapC
LIVVDTSVIVAIAFRESERLLFYDKILDDGSAQISAVSYMEAGMVLTSRLGNAGEQALDQILQKTNITVTLVSPDQAKVALEAFRRYGKGRHPAGLNFGDCFSYALAKSTGEPLLFKGLDFAKTDVVSA